jgi:hypothetical protein
MARRAQQCRKYWRRPVDFKRSPMELLDPQSRMSRLYDDWVSVAHFPLRVGIPNPNPPLLTPPLATHPHHAYAYVTWSMQVVKEVLHRRVWDSLGRSYFRLFVAEAHDNGKEGTDVIGHGQICWGLYPPF